MLFKHVGDAPRGKMNWNHNYLFYLTKVVNLEQIHWVAFRVVEGRVWFLDSQSEPQRITFEQLMNYITVNRNAFLVRSLCISVVVGFLATRRDSIFQDTSLSM